MKKLLVITLITAVGVGSMQAVPVTLERAKKAVKSPEVQRAARGVKAKFAALTPEQRKRFQRRIDQWKKSGNIQKQVERRKKEVRKIGLSLKKKQKKALQEKRIKLLAELRMLQPTPGMRKLGIKETEPTGTLGRPATARGITGETTKTYGGPATVKRVKGAQKIRMRHPSRSRVSVRN